MALLVIEIVVAVIGLSITVNTLNNLRAYHRLGTFASAQADTPYVSVLVPARDEERGLADCLASLCVQEYARHEVIVLDDGSTDATGAIAAGFAQTYPTVRVIAGAPLPDGWLGKAWACQQLADAARGDVLLFTDADTVHTPGMIRCVVGAMAGGADLVTAFPEQETGSWSEVLLVPLMLFTVWTLLPVGRVWSDPSARFVAANGQLLAFTRAAYTAIGGHAAVCGSVLDDMGLARRAKRGGLRVRLADGVGTVRTRMYRSAGETWRGFSKNAYGLVGGTIVGAVGIAVLMLALYVAPLVSLLVGVAAGRDGWTWRWLPLLLLLMLCVQRGIVAVRGRLPLWHVALHPLSVLLFVVILANSVRWHRRGYGEWKGRRFATGPARRDGDRR